MVSNWALKATWEMLETPAGHAVAEFEPAR